MSSASNWIGTFRIDEACNPNNWCCLSGHIKLSSASNNQIQIIGTLHGQCGSLPSTFSEVGPIPQSFQEILTLFRQTIRIQLGPDNSFISTVNSSYPYYGESALRASYNVGTVQSMSFSSIICSLSVSLWVVIMMGKCE